MYFGCSLQSQHVFVESVCFLGRVLWSQYILWLDYGESICILALVWGVSMYFGWSFGESICILVGVLLSQYVFWLEF